MSIGWNFPSNNYGTLNGIGEAGIETFKGMPYRSLAREICQNSLDAKIGDKPVVVEFSCFQIETSDVPGFQDLKEAVESCLKFWTEQGNKKTVDFLKRAAAIAKQDRIPVLRISDFNTTGLVGSDQDYNTPWQNLVKASGVSNKEGSAGGSFGIGKSAPFASSELRTVFYATKDKDRLEASQGIARLVSFIKRGSSSEGDTDNVTTGIGYYGETEKNRAVTECKSLDSNFCRTGVGTDVFVLGFSNKAGWEQEVAAAVLDDFLISVYRGLLEVRVSGTTISRDTLPDVIKEFKDTAKMAYNYYQALTMPEAKVIETDFYGLGSIELHILIQNGLHRRVFMSRRSGMKVFDQKNISSIIQFAGICILKDENINAYFRQMENPQHDAWEPERHEKPSEAKRYKQKLFRYIKDSVMELGRKTTVEETDAEGVGEYLPDDLPEEGAADKREAMGDTTKDINLNISARKNARRGYEIAPLENGLYEEDGPGIIQEEDYGDTGSKDYGDAEQNFSSGGSSYGGGEEEGRGKNGDGKNPYDRGTEQPGSEDIVRKRFEIHTMSVRLLLKCADKNRYRLIFTPEKTSGEGYLQFKLSGEQSDMDVNVSNAVDGSTWADLRSSGNRIYLNHIVAKARMSVEFDVGYSEQSSMEVSLYGYQI